MKKKNGFTLIELLAIIVILAIIAVITVPIILNSIENSKKGAAVDSAYGYKESVNKYFFEELMSDKNFEMDGNVFIENGELVDNLNNTYNISVSGVKPTDGFLVMDSGNVKSGCLTINGYKVEISLSEAKIIGKGDCKDVLGVKSFSVGDYIEMTPTSTSYDVVPTKTGYSVTQNINPSNLKLWRVIKVYDDGKVDIIAANATDEQIYFHGQTGYLNLVGTLNEIADQYGNSEYTVSCRSVGYDYQTEFLNSSSVNFTQGVWTSGTEDNSRETSGGGDIKYTKDTDLIKKVLGTLELEEHRIAWGVYWLASRGYYYTGSASSWYGRIVSAGGSPTNYDLILYGDEIDQSASVRPILTLRADIEATGLGSKNSPYILQ